MFQPSLFVDDGEQLISTDALPDDRTIELGQYQTPRWVAEQLVALFTLDGSDHVLEPTCGTGSFLHAVPVDVPATGIEIDPLLAERARIDTGRAVITGDFTQIRLDATPTCVIGNPPFSADTIAALLRCTRSWLEPAGRAGYILPAHSLSFAARTTSLLAGFNASVDILPRDIYPRISFPLVFLRLTRTASTRLQGFLLFDEAIAVRALRAQYRAVLENGRKPMWREVLEMALRACGGQASLTRVYEIVEGFRPTSNPFWRDAIRREAGEHCIRVSPGIFRLRESQTALGRESV